MVVGFHWILLLTGSYFDIRYRALPNRFLLVGTLLAAVFAVLLKPVSWFSLAGGIGLGAAVVGLSALTKGGIGKGDGLFLGMLGINLGFFEVFFVFLSALFLAALAAAVVLLFRKGNRKSAFPFVPFLALAYGVSCFI